MTQDALTPTEHNNPVPVPGKCNAKRLDGSGMLCRNGAGARTDHLGYGACFRHGGSTKNGRKNGRTVRALGEAGKLLEECRTQVEGRTTVEALQDLRAHAASMVLALSTKLAEQDRITTDSRDGEQAHIYAQMLGEWVDRSARVEKIAADLGLEARRIAIDQQTSQILMVTLQAVLQEQGVDPGRVIPELGSRLRAIETGATER